MGETGFTHSIVSLFVLSNKEVHKIERQSSFWFVKERRREEGKKEEKKGVPMDSIFGLLI